ncbi:pirin family protein [Dyella sp.]|jgi:redox-sensitive bicupin YhaK (pirin superfamily)|uniref:pirin family protein n=1 Tax=Dyella sp. TaxID=1869338 RepID=UPI002D777D2F|nr:pirin-like C-terminal cupin domain-containing protein [Dyella sp.]HET6431795.1 pirin-like C-terminal cupin domain-containing protein [Dyella sp.]
MYGPLPARDPVFSRPLQPRVHPAGAGGRLRQFRHDAFDRGMSPLLVVDHVQSAGPEMEPLPHAGLSVATLLFEHAQGEIESVDSAGARHCIRPGDLHWTLAGRGVVRQARARGESLSLDALQILVNSPSDLKQQPPASFHLAAAKVPLIALPGSRLRLLAGQLGAVRSPLVLPQPLLILDGRVDAGATVALPLPAGWNAWVYALSGELALEADGAGTRALPATTAVTAGAHLADVQLRIRGVGTRSHLVVVAGAAINEPLVQHGPFVMNTRQEVMRVVQDYEAGRLGRL